MYLAWVQSTCFWHYSHLSAVMSSSTGRKSDRSRRRNQEEDGEDGRNRDITPRGFGHNPATCSNMEGLGECVQQCHLDDCRSASVGEWDDYRGSTSENATISSSSSSWGNWKWATAEPRGYWWRSKENERNEVEYEYDSESEGPNTEPVASSSRYFTIAQAQELTSSQISWHSNYTQSAGPHQIDQNCDNVASRKYYAERSSNPVSKQRVSYNTSQRGTKPYPAVPSQGFYLGRTVFSDNEESPEDHFNSTGEGSESMSTNISGSDFTQPPQLPPMSIPPPIICGCDARDNLCGVLIFPSRPKPKDGKISSKRSTSKAGSSSAFDSGESRSGSGKLSAMDFRAQMVQDVVRLSCLGSLHPQGLDLHSGVILGGTGVITRTIFADGKKVTRIGRTSLVAVVAGILMKMGGGYLEKKFGKGRCFQTHVGSPTTALRQM
ncbi:hypothetical protein ONS95_009620 [Cadophora gregata]|uniref:uncharacterized protein n=1 Tax=Cadophora gregata TaxID=51156 RepID=UPI0026DAFF1B|nr:uncharacterized protein ONS95_009620 [Cadophora gregata]KAK0124675.1 hypothetical protein ONS95_009620 [Cadophora gregata]KAK0129465.1 hypothetical protein ONS96_000036 [Cadophora gregata f. sp. sojae]